MMFTAYYDLAVSPPTFDIVGFLLSVEAERVRRNKKGIRIEILPGPVNGFRNDKFWPFTVEERRKMLDCVAVPMAMMLPSAEVVVRSERPAQPEPDSIGFGARLYGTRRIVYALSNGIRPLRPSQDSDFDHKLVTITLREGEHWPQRNSNLDAWLAAAERIWLNEYKVIVVRDERQADSRFGKFQTSPEASRNLQSRAKLYRSAACNLFVSNGPAWFAMALDAPVLMFKPATENLMKTCSSAYLAQCGIPIGGQIPNAPLHQWIVWRNDDEPQWIAAAVDAFMCTRRRLQAA